MCNFGECELFPVFGNGRACASAGLMKGVFLIMRIYQPVRGVGGALRENSFVIIDDAGVEIGQGGLEYRVIKKMLPDRPLDIEMTMNAHPMASDTLFGALSARAERIKDEEGGLAARLYTRCAIEDAERHEYFTRMGFDDYDGVELFVLNVPQDLSARRRNYSPVGTKSIDVDLRTRTRREEFLLGLKEFGCVEHASEWLEERMRGPVFMAKAMYYGSDYVGSMLVTGTQAEATLEMVCVEPKWRGRGVASALDANVECVGNKVFALTRIDELTEAERSYLRTQGII